MSATPLEPPIVPHVPDVIPDSGATVKGIILMPAGSDTAAITHDEAIALGRKLGNARPFAVSAILARVTIPGTITTPHPVQNTLVWVVTFTSPTPINVAMGGPYLPNSQHSPRPIWVTHHNLLFDAQSGEFRWGFFTP